MDGEEALSRRLFAVEADLRAARPRLDAQDRAIRLLIELLSPDAKAQVRRVAEATARSVLAERPRTVGLPLDALAEHQVNVHFQAILEDGLDPPEGQPLAR
jgi:hypothetical protein